ncbi:hypothetical protein WGT02_38410 (plasmid) [Rhizobium sp. T1470]|uniref:hypothetical protein n=1 Tax=unclassified Rhizobium TaxID=2613769 RepID=UPI001AAF6512|nr:hypothetical protein [Rhizobium sp. T1473]MCA0807287.1 hypothetical protein [Rhizobium sp. T1473]
MKVPNSFSFRFPNNKGMMAMQSIENIESQLGVRQAESAAAGKFLKALRKLKENSAEWHLTIGLANYAIREYGVALKEFEVSYALEGSAECAARLALAAWRLGDNDNAQDWIQRAIAVDSKGSIQAPVGGQQVSFMGVLATILLSKGDIEAVEKASVAALEQTAEDHTAMWTLATVRMTQGNAKEASQLLSRAANFASPDIVTKRIDNQLSVSRGLLEAGIALRPGSAAIDAISRLVV